MIEPVVIVGGGIAGSVAAAALARAGRAPLVLERSRGAHHKVCGEFLSWEAGDRLSATGFDLAALGGARIGRVRLFADGYSIAARLPRAATGISRFRLDEALLDHAAAAGARVERGVAVRAATAGGGVFTLDAAGSTVTAKSLLLATGKTNLRGLPRQPDQASVVDDLVGFKMHYRLTAAQNATLAGTIELHLSGDGGYAGLQHVEDGIANLCLLVPKSAVAGVPDAQSLADMLGPLDCLAARLAGAEALFERPLTIAGVPYGFLHDPAADPPRLLRLGDQFAVVHSFTGDGMAIAATSGSLAGLPQPRFGTELSRRVGAPVRVSTWLGRGLRAPAVRRAAFMAARLWPGIIGLAARATRVRT